MDTGMPRLVILLSADALLILIIAYGESVSFCNDLAVKVIDALSHRLKNVALPDFVG